MLKLRNRKTIVTFLSVMAAAGLLIGPAAGSSLASIQTHTAFAVNTPNCHLGGQAPCVATTQDAPVILYLHSGSTTEIGIANVTITCYYFGTPVVNGDNVEDHVVHVAGPNYISDTDGHVPDAKVNLGGENPWNDGIPQCS